MKDQSQFAIAKPRRVPWLAWIFLNFVGVVHILPMVSAVVSAEAEGGGTIVTARVSPFVGVAKDGLGWAFGGVGLEKGRVFKITKE